jgi:RecA-family ATPase
MSEEAFDLVKGSLARRKQSATTVMLAEPTPQEIEALFLERITPETELPPMQPLFRMNEENCFYRGELVADCGKAKSGKTFFLSILMAGALKKQMLALERLCEEPLKVLWIDTEQSQQSTQEILKERVMPLAEVGQLDDTQFFAFNLRGLGFETRRRMVDVAVKTIKPDICIIDGIKDLMTDINDAVQATNIMEELMALAKDQKCCIVCVLHLNKSMQDWNMRGSIGTELTNKAFEVFQCAIIEDHGVFKVTHSFSRKQKMKRKFYYVVNDKGLPEERSDYQEQPRDDQGRWVSREEVTKKNPDVDPDVDLVKLFSDAMEGRRQRPFNELMAVALKKCGVPDAQTYYAYFAMAEEKGIVRKEDHPETHVTWVEFIDNPLPF